MFTFSPSLMLVNIAIVVTRSSQITDQKSTTDTFSGAGIQNKVGTCGNHRHMHNKPVIV